MGHPQRISMALACFGDTRSVPWGYPQRVLGLSVTRFGGRVSRETHIRLDVAATGFRICTRPFFSSRRFRSPGREVDTRRRQQGSEEDFRKSLLNLS